jgi:hypothetical protein
MKLAAMSAAAKPILRINFPTRPSGSMKQA